MTKPQLGTWQDWHGFFTTMSTKDYAMEDWPNPIGHMLRSTWFFPNHVNLRLCNGGLCCSQWSLNHLFIEFHLIVTHKTCTPIPAPCVPWCAFESQDVAKDDTLESHAPWGKNHCNFNDHDLSQSNFWKFGSNSP